MSMRVLIKDQSDGTLVAVSVSEAYYDKEKQHLYFDTSINDGYIVIPNIPQAFADNIIISLYMNGKADLTEQLTYFNEDPPDPTSENKTEDNSKSIFGGIFKKESKFP